MSNTIEFKGSREDLRRLLTEFVHSISGSSGAFAPYVRGIKIRAGMVALAAIQEAFLVKSMGGTDEAGIKWKPLSKYTIARRRLGPGDKALMKGYGAQNGKDVLGRIKRGFLTPAQDLRWRQIYGTRKASMMVKHGMGEREAGERAAQIAWATLKSEGAKTKLDVLGSRSVALLRDTGRLFNSLSPGVADPDSFPVGQAPPEVTDRILREGTGAVVVGTSVEYAGRVHAERPLWPSGDLPPAWQERINEAVQSGIEEAIEMIIGGSQRAA